MGEYAEFHNICFVDTLDNVGFQKTRRGQLGLSFGLGLENAQRIKRQNERELSVIIGNPPYNSNQKNENDNNKNRTYQEVDKRIKDTYIARSTAQKTALYDMYARFFRWASDRLADNGVLAFITNSSFVHARTFDGFRKSVADEFSDIYLVDLGGDVRANPKLSGTKHNVFGIQTGVAMAFFIKQPKKKGQLAKIHYAGRPALETAAEKLTFLHETKFKNLDFDRIKPDAKGNWLGQTDNDWTSLVPLIDRDTKGAKNIAAERALFKQFGPGYMSGRDEWVTGETADSVAHKMQYLIDEYDKPGVKHVFSPDIDLTFKWSRNLKNKLDKGGKESFDAKRIVSYDYRPFIKRFIYRSPVFIDEQGLFNKENNSGNMVLLLTGPNSAKEFMVCSSQVAADYHYVGAGASTQCIPLDYRNTNGDKQPNITAWGLARFRTHYADTTISGEDIFHYAYAVLHDPHYRAAYAQNLKQDFPRLPFHPDFAAWATAGKQLLELHLNYEKTQLLPGLGTYTPTRPHAHTPTVRPKVLLKADSTAGIIYYNEEALLSGIPAEAWRYRLGNRSALEWVLDQYKERTPKDPTIRAQFDTYRFADHTEAVADLLARVCTVSVETIRIVDALAAQSPLRPGA